MAGIENSVNREQLAFDGNDAEAAEAADFDFDDFDGGEEGVDNPAGGIAELRSIIAGGSTSFSGETDIPGETWNAKVAIDGKDIIIRHEEDADKVDIKISPAGEVFTRVIYDGDEAGERYPSGESSWASMKIASYVKSSQ